MLFLAFGMTMSFSSCSDDDEKEMSHSSNKIVGKWKSTYDDGYCILTFKKDGTGSILEYEDGDVDNDPFYYTYDDEINLLTFMWIEDGQIDDTDCEIITWINSNSFVLDGEVWKKQ